MRREHIVRSIIACTATAGSLFFGLAAAGATLPRSPLAADGGRHRDRVAMLLEGHVRAALPFPGPSAERIVPAMGQAEGLQPRRDHAAGAAPALPARHGRTVPELPARRPDPAGRTEGTIGRLLR
jgi:hypothetical protein